MADVFISYRRTDRDIVIKIREALEALKLSVWFDARLQAGESFNQEITREARNASVILVCWSPDAAESDWVQAEALIGIEEGKLVACSVLPMDLSTLPVPFNTKHTLNLTQWVTNQKQNGFYEVLARIGALVDRPGLSERAKLDRELQDLGTPGKKIRALENWVTSYPKDPLSEDTWLRIEKMETEESRRKIADRKARAAAAASARKPQSASPDETEARRDAAQGKAWRELGTSPTLAQLKAFVQTWKKGPLVDLAKWQLQNIENKSGAPAKKPTGDFWKAFIVSATVACLALGIWLGRDYIMPGLDPADVAAWEFAKDMNTSEAYAHYRSRFPEGEYFDEAGSALTTLAAEQDAINRAADAESAWAVAQKGNSEMGYREFIEKWPKSDYSDLARKAITDLRTEADRRAWAEAQRLDTVQAYKDYKDSQQNGEYLAAADAAIERIRLAKITQQQVAAAERTAWETARRQDTISGYREFLSNYDATEFEDVARERISTLQFEADARAAEANAERKLTIARQVESDFQSVKGNPACDQAFVIYFEWGRNDLTSVASQVLDQAMENMGTCDMTGALVSGHSDASGSRDVAFQTGSDRARVIRTALMNRGFPGALIKTSSFGQESPARATGDGVREPLNRRAEIVLRGTPGLPPFSLDALHPDVRKAVVEARRWQDAAKTAVKRAEDAVEQAELWAAKSRQTPQPRDTYSQSGTVSDTVSDVKKESQYDCRGQRAGTPTYRVKTYSGFRNGQSFSGQFEGCNMNGYGVTLLGVGEYNRNSKGEPIWKYYKGEHKSNTFNGAGEFLWASGLKYQGQWAEGGRTGYGVETYSSGGVEEGVFADGLLNGYGAIWTESGRIRRQGRWEKGRLVESLKGPGQ
jgi:outer membrane protein OmpA-like peptidoglycan-associated protein